MRFQLLGPMEVLDGTEPLPLGGPKQRLVLAHLLLRAERIVPAHVLIDEIWGDEPPAAARASLQSYLSNLRRALGPGRITRRSPGYLLNAPPDEIDAARFEAMVVRARKTAAADPAGTARLLREALGLWHGDAMSDLADEPSLWPEIERLTDMRMEALEAKAQAELDIGRHRDIAADLERMQRAHPLRERICAQLMIALYRSGRQADALAAYHRLREALDQELGVEPSPALDRLQLQILNHDPSLELRGQPLRGYRLLEPIGSGRLGTVHRGFEPQAEREVAIKVLGARVANDHDFIRRFDADAGRVARLEHPHIVPLHDWWREPDAAYLVMRLMGGGSLAARVANGGVSRADALVWIEQIGSALATAHRHGVIHGDVRPANVLLDDDGNAYLGDFDVGYDVAGSNASSRPSALRSHLAPERLAGRPASVFADLYAFSSLVSSLLSAVPGWETTPELHAALARVASPDSTNWPSTPTELVGAVRRALVAETGAADAVDVAEGRNPYKGLRAFEEADAADFFGREALVEQLVARMGESTDASRLLAVVGPSGSGKSSLVSAGLVPAVRESAVNGSDRWFIASMTLGERPFEELERALLGLAVETPASLSELLEATDGLREAVSRVLPPEGELLLVIDQFEELFTLAPDDGTRDRFLALLAGSIDDPSSRVRLVITLRADFYDQPLSHERFGVQLAARTLAVPPLTPEQLERVVAAPAERVGLRLEPGLVARAVAEMTERPGALPLLQYALTELWERRDGSRLSLRAYEAGGGIAAAVGRRAEELVVELDDDGRETARQVFLRLVELGEGASDTARRVLRRDLQALVPEGERVGAVIDRFARYRMLLLDRDPETRGPTVELAHEALLRAWPRLRRWLDEARDDVRGQRRLAVAAAQWEDGGRDSSFLLTGSRLQRAAEWAATTRILLTPAEGEYLAASILQRQRIDDEEERRRRQELALEHRAVNRLRALVVALGIGALIAGGLSIFALTESQRAERETRVATARELAAAAVSNLPLDPERSILLALEAVHATRSADGSVLPEAEEALHRAVTASRIVLRVRGVGGALSWSPEGDLFVTEGPEDSGMLDIRSALTGESVREWYAHDVDVNAVAFSPDGSLLLSTGDDGTAALWRHDRRREAPVRVRGAGEVWGPTFSPNGSEAAAVWRDEGMLRIWDTSGSMPVREIAIRGTPIEASFSADGRSVAITLRDRPVIIVLDVATGEPLPFELDHGQLAADAAWSPDGRWIATAGRAPAIRVWDAATGELRHTLQAHTGDASVVQWSPDSMHMATGGSDGAATLWRISDDASNQILSLAAEDTTTGIAGLAFSPDGRFLMTGDAAIAGTQIWDIRPEGEAEWSTRAGEFGNQGGVAFLPDGRLVSSNDDGSVTVSDPRSGQEVGAIGATGSIVPAIAVSSDGELVATAGGADGVASVWENDGGGHRFGVAHQATVFTVDFTSDGALLASADNSGLIRITDRSGNEVAELVDDADSDILMVRFSPDGHLLAVAREGVRGGESSVAIWDWQTGEIHSVLPYARDMAFDSTGSHIATAGPASPNVDLWDVETGRHLRTLFGEVAQLWGIAWSADDTLIAAGSLDGPVRLWDVETGVLTLTLRGHAAPVSSLAFSPDGSQLASRSMDGAARVWALDLDDLIEIAAGKLHRGLTDAECLQYLHIPACDAGRRRAP